MNIFEIVSAIALIVACVFIIIVVLMNETKANMSQAISGGSADNFYQKNAGRTKEAKLNRIAVFATCVFFILALAVNIINVHSAPAEDADKNTSGIVTEDTSSDTSTDSEVVVDGGSSDTAATDSGAEEGATSTADESSAE